MDSDPLFNGLSKECGPPMTSYHGTWAHIQNDASEKGVIKVAYSLLKNLSEVKLMHGLTRIVISSKEPVSEITVKFKGGSTTSFKTEAVGDPENGRILSKVGFGDSYINVKELVDITFGGGSGVGAGVSAVYETFMTNDFLEGSAMPKIPESARVGTLAMIDAEKKTYPASKLANAFHWPAEKTTCAMLMSGQYVRAMCICGIIREAQGVLYGDRTTTYLGTPINLNKFNIIVDLTRGGAHVIHRVTSDYIGV